MSEPMGVKLFLREELWPGARWAILTPGGWRYTAYNVADDRGSLFLEGRIMDPETRVPRDATLAYLSRSRWFMAVRVNFEEVL